MSKLVGLEVKTNLGGLVITADIQLSFFHLESLRSQLVRSSEFPAITHVDRLTDRSVTVKVTAGSNLNQLADEIQNTVRLYKPLQAMLYTATAPPSEGSRKRWVAVVVTAESTEELPGAIERLIAELEKYPVEIEVTESAGLYSVLAITGSVNYSIPPWRDLCASAAIDASRVERYSAVGQFTAEEHLLQAVRAWRSA